MQQLLGKNPAARATEQVAPLITPDVPAQKHDVAALAGKRDGPKLSMLDIRLGKTAAVLQGESLRKASKDLSAWPLHQNECAEALTEYLQARQPQSISDPTAGVMGAYAEDFKKTLGLTQKYAIPVNSGTNGIRLAYQALGVKPGDRAAVAGYTFHATGTPLVGLKAKVVLMDADPETGNVTAAIVKKTLENAPNLKVLAVNHNWGVPVEDIEGIAKLCRDAGVKLLEDCSHAHGARVNGRAVGTFGDVAVFSTQDNKIIPTGEGGMLVTDDSDVNRSVLQAGFYRAKKAYGDNLPSDSLIETGDGSQGKARLPAISAVVGRVQLKHYETTKAWRKAAYNRLAEGLAQFPYLKIYKAPAGIDPVVYGIRVKYVPSENGGKSLEQFVKEAVAAGVPIHHGTSVPLSHQELFRTTGEPVDLPGADEYVASRVVFPVLTAPEDKSYPVIDAWLRGLAETKG